MNMNMDVISSTINVISQEEGRGALEEQRLPALQNARSLQDEVGSSHWQCNHPSFEMFKARCKEDHFDLTQVRAHLVQRLGLVNLEKLLRRGEHGFALPSFVK